MRVRPIALAVAFSFAGCAATREPQRDVPPPSVVAPEPKVAAPTARNENVIVTQPESGAAREPAFGEYIHADELPEAISTVHPEYLNDAQFVGLDCTVVVACLVRKDGGVGETRMRKSIPMLDEAAMSAVKQWRFKPAVLKGKPIAVWVDVPMRFCSH